MRSCFIEPLEDPRRKEGLGNWARRTTNEEKVVIHMPCTALPPPCPSPPPPGTTVPRQPREGSCHQMTVSPTPGGDGHHTRVT